MIKKVLSLVLLILVFLPSFVSAFVDPNEYERQQISSCIMTSKNGGVNCWGGSSLGVYNPNPAPNAGDLIDQMWDELSLAESYSNATESDIEKIKNRNSLEILRFSLFGRDNDTVTRMNQNIWESQSALYRIYALRGQCNCLDWAAPISIRAETISYTLMRQRNQVNAENDNKGLISDLYKAIFHPSKSHFADPDSWKWHGFD
jgi:hypothetical protein